MKEYLEYVKKIFKVLFNHKLYTKLSKFTINFKSLEFYKHIIVNSTVKSIISKIEFIDKCLILKTIYKI